LNVYNKKKITGLQEFFNMILRKHIKIVKK